MFEGAVLHEVAHMLSWRNKTIYLYGIVTYPENYITVLMYDLLLLCFGGRQVDISCKAFFEFYLYINVNDYSRVA